MEFLSEYGLFLAKAVTIVIAILFVVVGSISASQRHSRQTPQGAIEVKKLNKKYDDLEKGLKSVVLSQEDLKQQQKEEKKRLKTEKKKSKDEERKKRIYVINFNGDIKASAVSCLREEVTAILTIAEKDDEVVVCLESPGGMVHGYGLAASQLARITQKEIPLTVAVDAVAASGGYMMACIGNKIIAAPFAVIGSIGVIAQLPNFNRLLKKHDIDYEMFTAGEYKRTVTMFGENTDKGKEKFIEELEDTHQLFKDFVAEHRPQVDIAEVATGEVWYGKRAIERQLIDEIQTSDEYLLNLREDSDIFSVKYSEKKSLQERLKLAAEETADGVFTKIWEKLRSEQWFK